MPHHILKNVLTQNVFLTKLQQHVLVLGKYNGPQKLQAALREVHIQDWTLAVQLSKATLYIDPTKLFSNQDVQRHGIGDTVSNTHMKMRSVLPACQPLLEQSEHIYSADT